MALTTTQLLASIKSRGLIPTNQSTFTVSSMLDMASEVLRNQIVKTILSQRQEYLVHYEDFELTAGVTKYRIPSRAIGMALRDVTLVNGDNSISLNLFDPERVGSGNTLGQGFYLQGNFVILHPASSVDTNCQLRLSFHMRPNKLVEVSAAGKIIAVDTDAGTIEVESIPATFTLIRLYDIVKGTSGYETLDWDMTPTNIAGSVLTFDNLDSSIEVGDYLCLAEESPIAQIPEELHAYLSQKTLVNILQALGDNKGLDAARRDLDELEACSAALLAPRVSGESKKLINTSGTLGFNRRSRF